MLSVKSLQSAALTRAGWMSSTWRATVLSLQRGPGHKDAVTCDVIIHVIPFNSKQGITTRADVKTHILSSTEATQPVIRAMKTFATLG